jgi:hypothetical protein
MERGLTAQADWKGYLYMVDVMGKRAQESVLRPEITNEHLD